MDKGKLGTILLKIAGTILLVILLVIIWMVGSLITYALLQSTNVFLWLTIIYIIVGLTLCILIWNSEFVKKHMKFFMLFFSALIIIIIYVVGYSIYVKNIDVVKDGNYAIDLFEYQPFSSDITEKLEEESTLKFDDNFPKIDCATALYPIISSFVEATYPKHVDVALKDELSYVHCNSTPLAYENLIDGTVDIIFVAGPSKEQLDYAREKDVNLKLTPIAKEAFVFFVNYKNPINNLTTNQIKDIYSGKITNWKDVGGKNSSIKAFQRNTNSGSQTALVRLMDGERLMQAPKDDVINVMGGIIEDVSDYKNFKNSIGFSFRFYSTTMVKNNKIKLLQIDGVSPNIDMIITNEYPLTSEVYAVTTDKLENQNIEKFIEWILSDQGQSLIEKTGYVPIN